MPKVSVVITTYNHADFLPKAIESVLAQTYKDYEIIIIDDGSTDNTRGVLAPYFDKIKYIYQQNQGLARARNAGTRHSQGKYIAFLDADDIWAPEKLSLQVDCLDNNPEIALVYSWSLWQTLDGKLIKGKNKNRSVPSGDIFNILFFYNFISGSTVLVRKSILNTVGLFDESFTNSQDWDLWLRIAREYKISGIGKPLCKYLVTYDSLSRKNKETSFECTKRVIEKHYKLSQDLGRPIAHGIYKKALAYLFSDAGWYHLTRGDRKKALENFLLSLKYEYGSLNLSTIRTLIGWYIKWDIIRRGYSPFSLRVLRLIRHCLAIYFKQVLYNLRIRNELFY